VPPLATYQPPDTLQVTVNEKKYDVLAFHPTHARELLSAGGFPSGKRPDGQTWTVEFVYPEAAAVRLAAEILQQQWRRNLGVDVRLVGHDFPTFLQIATNLEYRRSPIRGTAAATLIRTGFSVSSRLGLS
jgi:ABC-type transport system substrate-binding protein